jgi:hypothetical protein
VPSKSDRYQAVQSISIARSDYRHARMRKPRVSGAWRTLVIEADEDGFSGPQGFRTLSARELADVFPTVTDSGLIFSLQNGRTAAPLE